MSTQESEHLRVLRDVLDIRRPVSDARQQLDLQSWGKHGPIEWITVSRVRNALELYVSGRLIEADLRAWAEAIEMRDDIGIASEGQASLEPVMFELATPELYPEITRERAVELLASILGDGVTQ